MTARSWANTGLSGNWNVAANWTPAGIPTSSDAITIGHTTGYSLVVTIPTNIVAAASTLTITAGGTYPTTLTLAGTAQLNTTGAITLTNALSRITGAGTISAGGSITGAGMIEAVGGTLTVNGTIASGPVLAIDTASASELLINGTATSAAAIALSNSNQTLGIGSTGALTISAAQSVTNAKIAMGGGSLTDTKGLTLTSGVLIGHGTLNAAVTGGGTITADTGTLTVTGSVDATGTASSLVIDNGSTLTLTSTAAVGAALIHPTLTFVGNGDLFIDTAAAVGTLHFGLISGFSGTDAIKIKAIGGTDTVSWNSSTNVLTVSNGGTSETFTFAAGTAGQFIQVTTVAGVDTLTICFYPGTLIRTPAGEVAVETLTPGDLVTTTDGVARPVSWLGKQTISTRFADPMRSFPIRVKAGALGENVPARDLLISPDHALLVDGVLIHAGALVNGTSVVRETKVPQVFVYYHVELDDHSLILAENTPAETFVDNVDRLNFDNWAEHEALYPEGKPIVELPYPRAKGRRQVPVDIRVAIAARAEAIGAVEATAEVA